MKIEEKRWDKNKENEIKKCWENEDWWKFDWKNRDRILVIDTPPPYTAEIWHLGCLSYIYQDFVARSYRMMGYNVLYPAGWDRNGIKIEGYVERSLGINMFEYDREKFLEICKENLDKFTSCMRNILKDLMVGIDWSNEYLTDSEEYRKITQKTFIELWKKGLIYIDDRANWYCPECRTTIANAEVEYKEKEGYLNYINFDLENGKKIQIATTRPELLGACKAIMVNPNDERYKDFIGLDAIVPLYNYKVKIIGDESADPEFGTGAVMICSYGDFNDVKLFEKHKLEPKIIIDIDGKMKDEILKGLTIREARKKIVELLDKNGYLAKREKITHKVPIHDKCKKEVEIIPMPEYYLKQVEFLKEIEKLAYELKFVPERERNRLLDWIRSVTHDWPISRRRIYATEIPVWKCKKCGHIYVPEPGKYYKPWKEKLEIDCPKCGSKEWEGETEVFDTWFDSSITILYITKYFEDPEIFEKAIKIRPQGYDIVRTWLYYTLLRTYQLTGKRAFEYALISGMALDDKGRKMSKSLGNVIQPEELIEKYEIDAIRFWLAMYAPFGENYRVSEDKIKGSQKFITKLWNIARFVSMFEKPEKGPEELKNTDKWILSELSRMHNKVLEYYKNFEFFKAAQEIYNFTWDIFASHYLEMVKKRLYEKDVSGRYTCYFVLEQILKLLAPLTPGITDYIWRKLYSERSIHYENFDDLNYNYYGEETTKKIIEFNSFVWNKKRSEGLSLRDSISIEVPEDLKDFEEDLIKMHNIYGE